jgi:sRNA-binding protein
MIMDTLNTICAKNLQPKKKNTKSYRMKETLIEELPNCFKKGDGKQPLCINIHIQVHTHYKDDPRFEPNLIQQGLNKYCNSPKYIKNIIAGVPRIDIHGAPASIITAEEEAYAKKRLQKIDNDLQIKLQQAEEKILLKIASIEKQIPPAKPEPIPIALEELRKKIAIRAEATPQTSPSKEELKKKKQDKYPKKMARKTAPRKS